ncbi:MAG: glycosyltransferase family 2 protein [Austwickia sp.]|nr:glycosyltransferase family 2 protein [Actinomycetota bacterium]MCO5310233.1 glycosyltransferase family 2 protein [Austwickia sp.]
MRESRNYINPTVTIVVPVLNEARNLELILPELPPVYEVVLVDGNSKDDTVATARRLMPDIKVVTQTRKGKGNALVCGFAAATGDIIVMFDADYSADPAEIPAFVQALKAGADFAKGTRNAPGGGSEDITVVRGLGNKGLNVLSNVMIKGRYSDLCYGYNAFWRDILPALELPSPQLVPAPGTDRIWGDGFEIETLLTCRVAAADLLVTEVPSVERLRVHGASNLNAVSDGLRVLRTIVTERYGRGARPEAMVPAPLAANDTRPVPALTLVGGIDLIAEKPSRYPHGRGGIVHVLRPGSGSKRTARGHQVGIDRASS